MPIDGRTTIEGVLQNEMPEFHLRRERNDVVMDYVFRQTITGSWFKMGDVRKDTYFVPLEYSDSENFLKQVLVLQDYENKGAARTIYVNIRVNGADRIVDSSHVDLHLDSIPVTGDIRDATDRLNQSINAQFNGYRVTVDVKVTAWILTDPGKKVEVVSSDHSFVRRERSPVQKDQRTQKKIP